MDGFSGFFVPGANLGDRKYIRILSHKKTERVGGDQRERQRLSYKLKG